MEKLEDRTRQLIEDYWYTYQDFTIPINTYGIAATLGIKAIDVSMPMGQDGELLMFSKPQIYVNSSHSSMRRRYTVAHLLGHFVLTKPNHGDVVIEPHVKSDSNDLINRFAAYLLMPKDITVMQYIATNYDLHEAANSLGVSIEALRIRLTNLGYSV